MGQEEAVQRFSLFYINQWKSSQHKCSNSILGERMVNHMKTILKTSGKWFKGNLHMHTLRSDGRIEPEEAIRLYREAGYDFIALTDHWVQSETEQREDFLLLGGCEWDTGDMVNTPVFHIIGAGMERPVSLEVCHSHPVQKIIDAIRDANGIAILAHPAWSVTNPDDVLGLRGLSGVEIYNTVSGLPWNGQRADSSLYFDLWATKGKLFRSMAADDSHFYDGEHTRSYILVNAEELTAASIKKAIADGNFYASQGPRFESLETDGKVIQVRSSKVESIVFYSNSVWCRDRVFTGGVDRATYHIEPTDRYVRVELIDFEGNRAWSSPFAVHTDAAQ